MAVLAGIFLLAVNVSTASAFDLGAPQGFKPISPTKSKTTITLDGKSLTVDQVVDVARYGAKVQLSAEARQRSLNAYYLLIEGAREGIPIYFFNRGTGSGRQVPIFTGDPLSTEVVPNQICPTSGVPCSNRDFLLERQLRTFRNGVRGGFGPEVADEEIVRAMMVVRANNMVYEAATPQTTQMLLDLINKRVSPVVQSRGSPGEGDLPQMGNVEGTMVGVGEAYYRGQAHDCGQGARPGGARPAPGATGPALRAGSAFRRRRCGGREHERLLGGSGGAAPLRRPARAQLGGHDLRDRTAGHELERHADLLDRAGREAVPLAELLRGAGPRPDQRELPVQPGSALRHGRPDADHPGPGEPARSKPAQRRRVGGVDRLKKNILIQINSSDHNPAVLPGTSPSDSPELNTPWFLQYFVQGGPNNSACVGAGCEHGYILSNSNWDPISWVNDLEAFTIAIASMDAATGQVIQRFTNTFFTVIGPGATSAGGVLTTTEAANAAPRGADYTIADLTSEILSLANPVPALGNAIVRNVEDLEAEGRIKVQKARIAVDDTLALLGQELLTTAYWMNIREKQGQVLNIQRSFGSGPTAMWQAFREAVPWQMDPTQRPETPPGHLAYKFLSEHSAAEYHPPLGEEPAVSANGSGAAAALGLERRRPARLLGWLRPELYGYPISG